MSLQKISKIGNGAYGSVYLARNKENLDVAVKRNFAEKSHTGLGNIRELNMLKELRDGPFIISILDVSFGNPFSKETPMSPVADKSLKDDDLYFVLEYAPECGNTFFKNKTKCSISVAKSLACQLFLSLEYIHSKMIIHRDLKPSNILITMNNEGKYILKLCDFGMSEIWDRGFPMTKGVTTSWYRSPEVCLESEKYDSKIDMWAAGCVLIEMFGTKPFNYGVGDTNQEILDSIIAKHPRRHTKKEILEIENSCDRIKINISPNSKRKSFLRRMDVSQFEEKAFHGGLESVLEGLLTLNPENRWTSKKTLDNPYFKNEFDYITEVRKNYPPEPGSLPFHVIKGGEARKVAIRIVFDVFNMRKNVSWYHPKILFHAIDIFDRYLNVNQSFNNNPTEDIQMKMYMCLYISYKYFTVLSIPLSWKNFAPKNFLNPRSIDVALQFEKLLFRDTLDYKFYHVTLIEIPAFLGDIIDEYLIRDLLNEYGKIHSWEGGSVRALYRHIRKIQ